MPLPMSAKLNQHLTKADRNSEINSFKIYKRDQQVQEHKIIDIDQSVSNSGRNATSRAAARGSQIFPIEVQSC